MGKIRLTLPIQITFVYLFISCHFVELIKTDDLESPLRITQHPRSQVAVRGARVSFRCEYQLADQQQQHTNQGIVRWMFEEITPSNSHIRLKHLNDIEQFEFDTNALHILSYEPSIHTGLYRCLVNTTWTNPSFALLSLPANLSLAQIQQSTTSQQMSEVIKLDLSEGNVAHIACPLPPSNPPAVPQFFVNHQPIPILSTSNSRYKILPSGSLQISNVRLSDSGLYSCAALNPITLSQVNLTHSAATYLRVYEPAGTVSPTIVHAPQETNRVVAGANLTLECVAQGAPVPLVTWQKFGGGQLPPEGRASQVLGNLVIVDVREEDRGTYVCRAENGPGLATFKTALVEVFEAPKLMADSNSDAIVVKRGDRIEVRCPIKARPRPDVQWFKDGFIVESNKNGHRVTNVGEKSVLIIDANHIQSPSIYQCFAKNEYGSNQADIYVNPSAITSTSNTNKLSDTESRSASGVGVGSKRPQIILGPQNTTIYEGQSVVLLCVTSDQSNNNGASSASGSSPSSASSNTQINWLQNDLIIEPTLMRRFEINQLLGNLRIVSVQKSDAGVYKCIASNEFGMSTAEAHVTVKSVGGGSESSNNNKIIDDAKQSRKQQPKQPQSQSQSPQSSRPIVQQIGEDKILLRWHLIDSRSGSNIDNVINTHQPAIAYFKVDYKTSGSNSKSSQWLTIDEQIDPRKREYILTDLNRHEVYRFRLTTFFVNGELNHSYQSARFKLDPNWTPSSLQQQPATTTSSTSSNSAEFKLADIQVQISQIWAISSSSLGLKWDIFTSSLGTNKSTATAADLAKKINGFYIYYRKIDSDYDPTSTPLFSNNPIPIYNYTRINIPISQVENTDGQQSVIQQAIIDTYIIANLVASSQYEIKMTCYNLNGDLCGFSSPIYGLTLSDSASGSSRAPPTSSTNNNPPHVQQVPSSSSVKHQQQNEIYYMFLGIGLGAVTLLLVIVVVMYVVRQRQNRKLLSQLHNTSHKLTSSSCPTLIYEDSLRQQQQQQLAAAAVAVSQHHLRQMLMNQQVAAVTGGAGYSAGSKLIDTTNLFIQSGTVGNGVGPTSGGSNSAADSNSTNSQSMSTTTSSMTTPPAFNSADHQQHMLVLNSTNNTNNTVTTTTSSSSLPKPPPIPQHPPPAMSSTTNNRININLNPLNSYLDQQQQQQQHLLSPKMDSNCGGENFYHTLTTLGTLPNDPPLYPAAESTGDYTNATLNMHRAHQILLKQQQQQQLIMNTLKTLNYRSKQLQQQQQGDHHARSPSVGSMKRHTSASSSKRSKKGANKSSNKDVSNECDNIQQQQHNYYLLPNIRPNQGSIINPIRNIYNEVDLLTLEAALNQNNLTNLLLLNQAPQQSTFLPAQQQQQGQNHHLLMTSGNENVTPLLYPTSFFDHTPITMMMSPQRQQDPKTTTQHNINEYDESNTNREEEEPMLASHYASSGINVIKPVDQQQQHQQQQNEENRKLI